jgi:DNA-binding NtrC family response regulator
MDKRKILVCDDEAEMLNYIRKMLLSKGFAVETFASGKALLDYLEDGGEADLLLQDVRMPDMDGLEVLARVKKLLPGLPVIIMTAFGSIDAAVESIKIGAYDYVTKPFPREKILGVLHNALERELLYGENQRLKEELNCGAAAGKIIFASRRFREVYDMTLQVAESDANILLLGESGTGKELLAAAVHQNNKRSGRQFFSINCAALTDSLLESQIFGHIRGAFTGAMTTQKGILEEADGGTLFLDEIGDMSLAVQAKLLRVIQEREFMPVGSTRTKTVDIRFVAATNKNLEKEVAAGRFREDLFYRLSVITINIPPLRERPEDIEPLARHFIRKFAQGMNKEVTGITPDALARLQQYPWPGNVRELKNVLERGVILARSGTISVDTLPAWEILTPRAVSETGNTTLENLERDHIRRVLLANNYRISRSADILGISRKTLSRKIVEYNLATVQDPAE